VYFRRISRDRQGSEARKNQENPLRFFLRLYERQKCPDEELFTGGKL
jgi:hypothetical protein